MTMSTGVVFMLSSESDSSESLRNKTQKKSSLRLKQYKLQQSFSLKLGFIVAWRPKIYDREDLL